MKKRLFAVLAAVAVLTTIFAGCGTGGGSNSTAAPTASKSASEPAVGSADEKSNVEIDVMLPPWSEIPDTSKLDAFTEETGIKANISYVGWDQIHDKIVMAAVTNTAAADVFEVDWSWVGEFAEMGCMEPLDISEEDKKDIPNLVNFTADGQAIALPYLNDFRIMFYNTTHFEKAGIANPPATWDDLVANAKAIKEQGIAQYPYLVPLSVSEGTSTFFMLTTLARSGALFNEDGSVVKENFLSTFEFYLQLLNEHQILDPAGANMIDEEVGQMFRNGNISFSFGGPGPEFDDPEKSSIVGEATLTLIPSNTSNPTATIALPGAVGVSVYSKNKEAARKFVDWFLSTDMQTYMYKSQALLPTRTSVLDALNASGELAYGDVVSKEAQYIQPLFPGGIPTWYPEFSQHLSNTINAVVQGSTNPQDAADSVAVKAEELQKAA